MKTKPLDIVLLVFKILIPLILILSLAFVSERVISCYFEILAQRELGNEPQEAGLLTFVCFILLGAICSGVFLFDAISLLISKLFNSSAKQKGHIKYFAWMLLSPLATLIAFTLVAILFPL